ncbi:hypothetical protein C4571_00350 [Candidatus Parcubacteria bacterium]|nr:MAG: hypothetical protein C4571_00350 [Candidatus Parcubacteria bacterium]
MRRVLLTKRGLLLGFLAATALFVPARTEAATNISPNTSEHWAWNDVIGWIDFYNTNTVTVTSQKLEGYASSSIGDISFDCATTRNGNICGQSNYGVMNTNGNLSGWGWNDAYGWISFDCNNHGGCGTSNYRAYVDGNNGNFFNYAWNDIVGWVSFNCADPGLCATSNYKVITSWRLSAKTGYLDSTTFDTGSPNGAQLNSFFWLGSKPAGTSVRFQFATSNTTSGPWNFIGPDGTGNTDYNADPGVPVRLNYVLHVGYRYFRYRILIASNAAQTASPRVDDIVVNWSP